MNSGNGITCRVSHESHVAIAAQARADVDAIFVWLAHRSVRGAIAWYFAFQRTIERVAVSLECFGEAPESETVGRALRQSLFNTRRGRIYRIVFALSDTEILLLRVRGPGQPRLRKRDLPSE